MAKETTSDFNPSSVRLVAPPQITLILGERPRAWIFFFRILLMVPPGRPIAWDFIVMEGARLIRSILLFTYVSLISENSRKGISAPELLSTVRFWISTTEF